MVAWTSEDVIAIEFLEESLQAGAVRRMHIILLLVTAEKQNLATKHNV